MRFKIRGKDGTDQEEKKTVLLQTQLYTVVWFNDIVSYQQCFDWRSIDAQIDGLLALVGLSVQLHSDVQQGLGALDETSLDAEVESSASEQNVVDDNVDNRFRQQVACISVDSNLE